MRKAVAVLVAVLASLTVAAGPADASNYKHPGSNYRVQPANSRNNSHVFCNYRESKAVIAVLDNISDSATRHRIGAGSCHAGDWVYIYGGAKATAYVGLDTVHGGFHYYGQALAVTSVQVI